MDTAVALVQSYLHINGYFTVTEYPLLETRSGTGVRMRTDLDLLAVRFPGAGREHAHQPNGDVAYEPDPALGCPAHQPDMLVAEVKEGRAEFNAASRDPSVLAAALRRFGCCHDHDAHDVVRTLLTRGTAHTACGHRVRLVAFGGSGRNGPWRVITLDHVIDFLRQYLDERWPVLRHAVFKDPTLSLLAVLQKTGASITPVAAAPTTGPAGSPPTPEIR